MVEVVARPPQLDGCWKTWAETPIDVMLRTEVDSGALHTRRRFTGRAFTAQVSVTLKAELHEIFMQWFNANQQQGAAATYVTDPQGNQVVVQWISVPVINWIDRNAFTASVTIYHGAHM